MNRENVLLHGLGLVLVSGLRAPVPAMAATHQSVSAGNFQAKAPDNAGGVNDKLPFTMSTHHEQADGQFQPAAGYSGLTSQEPRVQPAAKTPDRHTTSTKQRIYWPGLGLLVGLTTLGIRSLLGDSQNILSATLTVLIPVVAAIFASFIVKNNKP
jgi:hypothetical protein